MEDPKIVVEEEIGGGRVSCDACDTEKEVCLWMPMFQIDVLSLPTELILEILSFLEEDTIVNTLSLVSRRMNEIIQHDFLWQMMTRRKFNNFTHLYKDESELKSLHKEKQTWKKVFYHCLYNSFSIIKIRSGGYACLASSTTEFYIANIGRNLVVATGLGNNTHGHDTSFPKDSRNATIQSLRDCHKSMICCRFPLNRAFKLADSLLAPPRSEDEFNVRDIYSYLRENYSVSSGDYEEIMKRMTELKLDDRSVDNIVKEFYKNRQFRFQSIHGGFISQPLHIVLYTRKDMKYFKKKFHGNTMYPCYFPWHIQSKNEDERSDKIVYQGLEEMEENYNFEITRCLLRVFPAKMENYWALRGNNFKSTLFVFLRFFSKYCK